MNPSLNLKSVVFYDADAIAVIFGRDKRWVWRHAAPGGMLYPYARRLGKQLFFVRAEIDRLANMTDPP